MDLSFFYNRHTVRSFSKREIDPQFLSDIIDAATHAPNTGNMQQYCVIVSRDPQQKALLAPCHFNQPAAVGCSALLTFCLDFNRFEQWCRISDAPTDAYLNFQAFVWSAIDTSIFAQQFCTIAELNGLGCCYLGTTTYNAPQIASILELPERVVPITTIAVGYPDESVATEPSPRLPLAAVMHTERYHEFTDAEVADLYRQLEERDDSRRFIAENGKQTLAQVFAEVRYPKSTNEQFSELYAAFVDKNFKLK